MSIKNNKKALNKAIASIILASTVYVFFLIYYISDFLSQFSDAVLYIIACSVYLLSVPGVIMAIWAKKSNIEEKNNVKWLSLIGMLAGSINIFLLTLTSFVLPHLLFNQSTHVMAKIAPHSLTASIIIFIVLLVIYFKSKPNKL